MRSLRIVKGVYGLVGSLPEGCRLCFRGGKVVVFVTGLCDDRCFYCPVGGDRLGRDVVYVDEEPARRLSEVVEEAYRVAALGAGVTGGDPLLAPRRTMRVIKALKEVFGPGFHVHLYTSGRYLTPQLLRGLERAGLDEIRFHVIGSWALAQIEVALRARERMSVGVEIPVLPGSTGYLKRLLVALERLGVEFINLNELEVSPSNARRLVERGYRLSRSRPVVEGSEETALEVLRWASENLRRISVHYCPASYKDRVQMRVRLVRKALRVAKPYERVTPQGTLQVFVAEPDEASLGLATRGYGEAVKGKVLLDPETARRYGVRGSVEERYPVCSSAFPLEYSEGVAEKRNYAP